MVGLQIHYRNVDSSVKSSDEHTNILIDAKLGPAAKDVNGKLERLTLDVSTVTTDISNIKKAIQTLADNQSNETQKVIERFLRAAREAKKPEVALRVLDAATSLVAVLRNEKYPASPEFFQATNGQLSDLTRRVEPAVRKASFAAQQQLAEYRSALTPIPSTGLITFKPMKHAFKIYPGSGVVGGGFDATTVSGSFFEPGVGKLPGLPYVQDAVIKGGNQILDGFNWKRVVFIGTHITYKSGEVKLDNVIFVNCTFDLPKNQKGARVAEYVALALPVLDSSPTSS